MSANDDKPKSLSDATDEELRRLIANLADAVRRGASPPQRTFTDKFWDRLSSVSTFVGSVVLGAVALLFNANYNSQQTRQSTEQFDFEKQKYEAEETDRRRKVMLEVIPKLFSDNEAEREGAQSLLLELYPNDAKEILEHVAQTQPKQQQEYIAPALQKAEARSAEVGTWGVVVGHDDNLDAARPKVEKAKAEGFTATVYKKRNWYITVAVGHVGQEQAGFASEDDADSANFDLSAHIRQGTYVVQLKKWCESPQQQGDLIQCSN